MYLGNPVLRWKALENGVIHNITSNAGRAHLRRYAQPALGAPRGVKGLLERAGFRVFNPTLPCHWPARERDVGCKLFGRVITAQMYVDTYLQARLPRAINLPLPAQACQVTLLAE